MDVDESTIEEIQQLTQEKGLLTEIKNGLSRVEQKIVSEIEAAAIRVQMFDLLKLLLVTGNALVFFDDDTGGVRVFKLDQYVVKRDAKGNVLEVIVKESINPIALPDEIRAVIQGFDPTDTKRRSTFTLAYGETPKNGISGRKWMESPSPNHPVPTLSMRVRG
jgi:hypothetical protein